MRYLATDSATYSYPTVTAFNAKLSLDESKIEPPEINYEAPLVFEIEDYVVHSITTQFDEVD